MCRQSTNANVWYPSAVRNASMYQYKASYIVFATQRWVRILCPASPSKTTKSDPKWFEVRSCYCRLVPFGLVPDEGFHLKRAKRTKYNGSLKERRRSGFPDDTEVRLLHRKAVALTHAVDPITIFMQLCSTKFRGLRGPPSQVRGIAPLCYGQLPDNSNMTAYKMALKYDVRLVWTRMW